MGDGCWAAFDTAPAAARTAVDIQQRLQREPGELRDLLQVRIGLHTGDVQPTDGDYFGPVPNRSARVADLANGQPDRLFLGQPPDCCPASTCAAKAPICCAASGSKRSFCSTPTECRQICARCAVPPHRRICPECTPPFLAVRTTYSARWPSSATITRLSPCWARAVSARTRLAIEIGEAISAAKNKVVQFCDLAPVADAEAVVASIADQVGARQQAGNGSARIDRGLRVRTRTAVDLRQLRACRRGRCVDRRSSGRCRRDRHPGDKPLGARGARRTADGSAAAHTGDHGGRPLRQSCLRSSTNRWW